MAAINDTILAVENIHEQLREIGFDKVVELDAAVTRVVLWSPVRRLPSGSVRPGTMTEQLPPSVMEGM